jgi:CBS domain-containing protein
VLPVIGADGRLVGMISEADLPQLTDGPRPIWSFVDKR